MFPGTWRNIGIRMAPVVSCRCKQAIRGLCGGGRGMGTFSSLCCLFLLVVILTWRIVCSGGGYYPSHPAPPLFYSPLHGNALPCLEQLHSQPAVLLTACWHTGNGHWSGTTIPFSHGALNIIFGMLQHLAQEL